MKEVNINIKSTAFPDQFTSDAKKPLMNLGYKLVKLYNMSGLEKMEGDVDFIINGKNFIG